MPEKYYIIADEHRQGGEADDPFLLVEKEYVCWRERIKNRYTVIHLGDTFDCALAHPKDIKKRWAYLDQYERNDLFLCGNHEIDEMWLQALAVGKVISGRLVLFGPDVRSYTLLHGHDLFGFGDDPWENLVMAHLGWAYKNLKWVPGLRRFYNWAEQKSSHRTNQLFFPRLPQYAIFGHSHEVCHTITPTGDREFINPGKFSQSKLAVFFSQLHVHLEQVIL